MERVMVLGALEDEIPLVEAFQEKGYFVIVVGAGMDYPCSRVADKYYDVDIREKEKLLEIAKKENIVAVSSNVVSIAVEVTAWLAEKLGLPGIGYDIAHAFTNKAIMREQAERGGVAVPPFAWAKTLDDAVTFADKHSFPLIIKPVDGNSSKGVVRVDNMDELEKNFADSAAFALNDSGVIIEGFIEGKEYIVDGFSCNGVCFNTDVAFKEHFHLSNNFVSKAVVLKDAAHCHSAIEKQLLDAHKKTVEALKLPYGPTHGEYIFCPKDNRVYLVEVAARGGGFHLSADLIPLATGINISRLVSEYALGNVVSEKDFGFHMHEGAAAWFAFALNDGIITSVSGIEDCKNIEGVFGIYLEGVAVGEYTRKLANDSGKYGPIIISGRSREDCYAVLEKVKETLHIEVDGKEGIIW